MPDKSTGRQTAELLAAYVDGVSELTASERRRVERYLASDAGARSEQVASRDLIGTLRELPESGHQPDWAALERSILDAVPDRVPRSFWHGWRLALPVLALGGATVLAIALTRSPEPEIAPLAVIEHSQPPAPIAADTVAVYLDGVEVELPIESGAVADTIDDLTFDGLDDPDAVDGFLAADDLRWVDELDDAELERASRSLEHASLKGPKGT